MPQTKQHDEEPALSETSDPRQVMVHTLKNLRWLHGRNQFGAAVPCPVARAYIDGATPHPCPVCETIAQYEDAMSLPPIRRGVDVKLPVSNVRYVFGFTLQLAPREAFPVRFDDLLDEETFQEVIAAGLPAGWTTYSFPSHWPVEETSALYRTTMLTPRLRLVGETEPAAALPYLRRFQNGELVVLRVGGVEYQELQPDGRLRVARSVALGHVCNVTLTAR